MMAPTPLPPLRILPASPADCPTLAHIYRLSFLPNAFAQALFGKADPDDVVARLEKRYRSLIASPRHALLKAVRSGPAEADGLGAEVVVAFAWWELPEPEGGWAEEAEEVKREFGPGVDAELVGALFADLEAHAKTIEGRHYHCKLALHALPPRPGDVHVLGH